MLSKINFAGNVYLTQKIKSTCSDKTSQNEIKHIKHFAHEFDCDVIVFDKQEKEQPEVNKYDTYCFNMTEAPQARTFTIGTSGIEGISIKK